MKRLALLALIVPLLITGVFISCLCTPAMAAVSSMPAFQSSHHCCCPDLSMPQNPDRFLTAAIDLRPIQDFSFIPSAFLTTAVAEDKTSDEIFRLPEKETISQDLYLKNKNLRI